MKIDRHETHDRYEYLMNQEFDIGKCCQSVIDQRPFGEHVFYIFAHARQVGTDEMISMYQQDLYLPEAQRKFKSLDDIPTIRLIWQPRLTKPQAQENSMLFKADPKTDIVEVLWIIPRKELWNQYVKGNVTESGIIHESIHKFLHDRKSLEARDEDDLSEDEIRAIYEAIRLKDQYEMI